jgi:general secretion pathway protein J
MSWESPMSRESTVKTRGFTLLEMLVALSLMALLAVMLSDGLRSGLDVTDRVESRSDAVRGTIRVHQEFRALIETAFPLRADDAHAASLRFRGDGTSLELVGPAAPHQPGGLTTRGILLEEVTGMHLTGARGWRLAIGSIPPDASLSYFGAPEPNTPPRWLASWKDRRDFPLLVRLSAENWPDVIARPRLREAVR